MESAPVTLTHLPEADDTRATLNQRLQAYHGGPAFDRLLREWRYQNHILGDVAKVLDEKA